MIDEDRDDFDFGDMVGERTLPKKRQRSWSFWGALGRRGISTGSMPATRCLAGPFIFTWVGVASGSLDRFTFTPTSSKPQASRQQGQPLPERRFLHEETNEIVHKALDCQTCHGGGPTDQFEPDFSIPTTLLPLDPENLPTRDDSDPFIAETVRYMEDVVVPAMQIMLDRPTFGCFGCHAAKK